MPTLDPELGQVIIGQELAGQGVRLATGSPSMPSISTIMGWGSSATPRFGAPADLVLVVVGVRADSAVAAAAVAELGIRDAIAVDRQMRTSLPGVRAAGDCVHTHHRLLAEPTCLPLAPPPLPPLGQLAGSRTRVRNQCCRPSSMAGFCDRASISHLLDYAGPHTTQHQPSRLTPSAPLEPTRACTAGHSGSHSTRPYCNQPDHTQRNPHPI
jgi:hypothetical protein